MLKYKFRRYYNRAILVGIVAKFDLDSDLLLGWEVFENVSQKTDELQLVVCA